MDFHHCASVMVSWSLTHCNGGRAEKNSGSLFRRNSFSLCISIDDNGKRCKWKQMQSREFHWADGNCLVQSKRDEQQTAAPFMEWKSPLLEWKIYSLWVDCGFNIFSDLEYLISIHNNHLRKQNQSSEANCFSCFLKICFEQFIQQCFSLYYLS